MATVEPSSLLQQKKHMQSSNVDRRDAPIVSASEHSSETGTKADYVRSQPQTCEHHCHWPGCDKQVPPAMWGCKAHWYRLPAYLRSRIWAAYRPGQEITTTPSAEYLMAAHDAQAWIGAHS